MKNSSLLQKIESLYTYIIFSLIIYVLAYNLFHYDPIQGYDGEAHHAYVQNFLNIFVQVKLINQQLILLMNFSVHPFHMYCLHL